MVVSLSSDSEIAGWLLSDSNNGRKVIGWTGTIILLRGTAMGTLSCAGTRTRSPSTCSSSFGYRPPNINDDSFNCPDTICHHLIKAFLENSRVSTYPITGSSKYCTAKRSIGSNVIGILQISYFLFRCC